MNQLSRYITVGVFNSLLGYAIIFTCMYAFGIGALLSNAIGYGVGLVLSFALNKTYTFQSREKTHKELPRFLIVFAISYGANLLMLFVLVHILDGPKGLSQIVSGIAYVGASYLMNKHYVFTRPES